MRIEFPKKPVKGFNEAERLMTLCIIVAFMLHPSDEPQRNRVITASQLLIAGTFGLRRDAQNLPRLRDDGPLDPKQIEHFLRDFIDQKKPSKERASARRDRRLAAQILKLAFQIDAHAADGTRTTSANKAIFLLGERLKAKARSKAGVGPSRPPVDTPRGRWSRRPLLDSWAAARSVAHIVLAIEDARRAYEKAKDRRPRLFELLKYIAKSRARWLDILGEIATHQRLATKIRVRGRGRLLQKADIWWFLRPKSVELLDITWPNLRDGEAEKLENYSAKAR